MQETLKHSKTVLAQSLVGSLGSDEHMVLFEPSEHLWRVWGLILNVILSLLPSFGGFSFALGNGVSFWGGIEHSLSMVFQQLVAILQVSQEKMSTHPSTLPGSHLGSPRFLKQFFFFTLGCISK